MRRRATALVAGAVAVVTLSLAGCVQLGDYAAPNDDECVKAAKETLSWLRGQRPIIHADLVEGKADRGTGGCDATFEATVPDDTTRSQFVPLATKIVTHLQSASTADSNLVDVKHGEQTTHLDRAAEPSELPWLASR